jgi:hypothetical protein
MNRTHIGCAALLALVAIAPRQVAAQRSLGPPTASHDHEFTGINGVRELRDGRVIVLDARDRTIHVINFATKSGKTIGRLGDGPGEFRLPRVLLPIGGDTTLVDDMARSGKLLVLTPAGEVGGLVTTEYNAITPRTFVVGAADTMGRFYENSYTTDSNTIVRWDRRRDRRDALARISMQVVSPLFRPRPASGSAPRGGAERSGGAPPPFFTVSQWAVSADGHLAVVTPEPYRVTLVSPSGRRVQSQSIPFTPVPVGADEKQDYRVERQQSVPTIIFANGVQTSTYRTPEYTEPVEWPSGLPAFLPNAVSYASNGTLWVKRATRSGAPPLYDVFDKAAKRIYQLELPPRTKLVGFGSGTVYLARVDEDDLHYLQRHALPR